MNSDNKWKIDKYYSSKTTFDIVSDASISSMNIANGKTIPLVIIDTTNYPDIEEAIWFHSSVQYGHVKTLWGKSKNDKFVCLTVNLIDPVPNEFVVVFDTQKHGGLVDLIINSQLLYIQPGKPKDRLSNTIDLPRLLIEVPSTHFANEWNKIFTKIMIKHFRKKGLSKKKAKSAAIELHKEWGIIRNFRLK